MEQLSKELESNNGLPRIVAFSREKSHCWSMMPAMLERIGKFAEKYCPDTYPPALVESVMRDFAEPKPGFFILGAMNEDYDLKGHMIACISIPPWSNQRRCLILQYGLDESLPIGLVRAASEMLVDWAKEQYCNRIIAETKTEQARRAFEIFYGFKTDMIQVSREL